MHTHHYYLVASLLAINAAGAQAQSQAPSSSLTARLDAAVAAHYNAEEPGAVVLVARDGKTLLRKGYGLADIDRRIPMDPSMALRIGSVTKQFTAAAILMLEEQGKLRLDDEVTRYLPGFNTHGQTITIEHLLTHTSGVYNYSRKHDFTDSQHLEASVDQLIASFKDEPLDFSPGTRWAYSNSGYVLLGAIIEKVSGEAYADFIHTRILAPLGMEHSAYEGRDARALPRATGYAREKGVLVRAAPLSPSKTYAAGALVSTVDDLARWDGAIGAGKLLKPASWQKMASAYRLADGRSSGYGYGWETGKLQGLPMVAHGGNTNGYSTYIMRVPGERLFVAVLSNAQYGIVQPDVVATRAAAIAIGKPLPEFRPIAMTRQELEAFTGVYQAAGQPPRKLAVAGGALVMQRPDRPAVTLLPHAANAFFIDKSLTHLEFSRDVHGKVTQLTLHQDGVAHAIPRLGDLPAERKPVVLPASVLDAYAGAYQMAPGFVLEVTREGDQLAGQATGQPQLNLLALAEGEFFVRQIDSASVRFEKGADGTVTGLVWTQKGRSRPAPKIR